MSKLRRFVVDVTFLFKALNGHLDVDFSQLLDFYSQEDLYVLRHFDSLQHQAATRLKSCSRTYFADSASLIGKDKKILEPVVYVGLEIAYFSVKRVKDH